MNWDIDYDAQLEALHPRSRVPHRSYVHAVICGVCNLEIENPDLADTYTNTKMVKQKKHGHCIPTDAFVPKPAAALSWPPGVSKSRKGRKSWRKRHKDLLRAHGLW